MKLPVKRWAYSSANGYFGLLASQDELPLRSDDDHRKKYKMNDAPSVQKRMSSNAFASDDQEFGEMFRQGGGVNFAQQHWSHIVFASLLAVVALAAVGVYVIIKRRRKATSPLTPEPPKQHQLFYPPVTIALTRAIQQPVGEQLSSSQSSQQSSPQPIRIKAKGLLERRGSNASLTIDLTPMEGVSLGTPPKEICSAEEYLGSAGNRLNRRQLRQSLKDLKVLHQEFLDMPLNHPTKLEITGISNKNRYKGILPNEATRVKLPEPATTPSPTGSNNSSATYTFLNPAITYINANYMRGYDGEARVFIATQGPLPNTINDFWLMVFTERAPCIVMMTKLRERNRLKCEPYLPDDDLSAQYGDIQVAVRSCTQKNGYVVRDICLKRIDTSKRVSGSISCESGMIVGPKSSENTGTFFGDSLMNDENTHSLKHYWFNSWPDHKAPASTAKQLLELAQEIDSAQQRRNRRPVVVHCSAGIGRTGCFIGTCIGMRQLLEENAVDILGIVCQMRLDRGGMIQTLEQYEFLHHAMIQYEKTLPETPTSAASLPPSSGSGSSARTPHSNSNSSSCNGSQQTSPTF